MEFNLTVGGSQPFAPEEEMYACDHAERALRRMRNVNSAQLVIRKTLLYPSHGTKRMQPNAYAPDSPGNLEISSVSVQATNQLQCDLLERGVTEGLHLEKVMS
jgi:hypothetical protein